MIGTPGQINRGSSLGEIIYNICLQEDVNTIVEIGTWNRTQGRQETTIFTGPPKHRVEKDS